ncbi:NYN domain-containing protein [Persephonella sp.]|uniref:LabA-like NYN domain-containing protein n=1 Tax=Persephonella sp. TaxID=2060922 RepID=UPI0025F3C0AA|nr:NYN domain-containing protein [Persephonella sp.]
MLGIFRKKKTKVVYRYPNERVVIFIDGGNMFHATNALKIKINYKKLVEILRKDRWLLRAYFYTGIPSGDLPKDVREQLRKQMGFLKELQNLGIKVKTMPLKKTPEGYIEKGIDILIATDMISLAFKNAYDTVVLVSGDSDFVPVVEKIQELGKRVENASFKKTSSYELRRVCDEFILLDNIKHRFTTPLIQEKTEAEKGIFTDILKKLRSLFRGGKR